MSSNIYQSSSASENRNYMEAIQVVEELASLLNTGLDKETLSICVRLIEDGINPTTLAHGILEIKRNATKLAASNAARTFNSL